MKNAMNRGVGQGWRMVADEVRQRGVDGAVAELGVYQGTFAAQSDNLDLHS